MGMPIVLFVDDEPNILKTLRRLFMDEEYDVHTADSGREALGLIEGGLRPTVIVSDQRMPEMGGAEFLAKASQMVPDSIRMVLTGYADINAAMAAINQGGIYRYILKPWNDEDLKLVVREAVRHFMLVEENRILTRELEAKSQRLAQVNEQLEVMVQTRTRELHQKVKELEGRDTIQQYLLQVHPLEDLLKTVLAVIVEVCQLEQAAYYAVADEGGLRLVTCQEAGEGAPVVPADDAALTAELMARVPLLAPGEQGEEGSVSAQSVPHGQFVYGLARVAKGSKVFGLLTGRRPLSQPFTEADLRTLGSFAMQAAVGINDCHFHDHYDDIQASLDEVLADISGQ